MLKIFRYPTSELYNHNSVMLAIRNTQSFVVLSCFQLSIAIEAANKDSATSSTVLSLARSSAALTSPRASAQMEPAGNPAGDPAMTEVQECCPCWMKFCTCNCIAMWKESSGYRAWRSMRHKIKKLVEHRYFEWAILLIIIASSVTLVRTAEMSVSCGLLACVAGGITARARGKDLAAEP